MAFGMNLLVQLWIVRLADIRMAFNAIDQSRYSLLLCCNFGVIDG